MSLDLVVGADADLVIVDLDRKVRITPSLFQSRCDWTIYDGWEVRVGLWSRLNREKWRLRRVVC